MALSKLAISLIAGIGSVAAIGGITAGVVVSRQNATQLIDSSNDEFNEPSSTNKKQDDPLKARDLSNNRLQMNQLHPHKNLIKMLLKLRKTIN